MRLMSPARKYLSALLTSAILASPLSLAADFHTELSQAKSLRDIFTGAAHADLLINNINIVDVYRESIYPGSLLIHNGKIVAINPQQATAKHMFDGQGLYAVPGLIDGHFHFESQLVTPTALAEAMVPRGTTSIFAECLDLVSAAGDDGLKAAKILFNRHQELPYRIYPFAPGKKVRPEFTKAMLDWDFIFGLGELNPSKIMNGDEELQKIAYARSKHKLLSSHVGDLSLDQQQLFPALGIMDDHDNWSITDINHNLQIGLPSFLLYGLHGVDKIVPGIVNQHLPTDNIMMSTDNLSVEQMVNQGGLDAAVRESIAYGLPPITAIKMSSYNTAKHFKLEDKIGSLTPGRFADILLVDNLRSFTPKYVFKNGELVAQNGKLLRNPTIDYSTLVTKPKQGLSEFELDDFKIAPLEISTDAKKAKVTVFNFYGFGPEGFAHEQWLDINNGKIVPELNGEKLLHFAIIERFPKQGKRRVKTGYIRQFALNSGAVAVGFSSPQPNVIAMGTDAADMLNAVKAIDQHLGGFAVAADGEIKQILPMNIYGMMTNYPINELINRSQALDQSLNELGHQQSGAAVNSLLEIFYLADRHGYL